MLQHLIYMLPDVFLFQKNVGNAVLQKVMLNVASDRCLYTDFCL